VDQPEGAQRAVQRRGLFVEQAMSAGEIVAVKGGHIRSSSQLAELPDPLPNSAIQITDDLHLVAGAADEYEAVMLFINHSCEPNVGFAGNVVLVAMRDIGAGEELTTDYALFDDYEGQMTCSCGADACRRMIDGRDWRRPELQRKYRGYFSWYLQRKIDAAAENDPGAS
jgi:hypothetical protein